MFPISGEPINNSDISPFHTSTKLVNLKKYETQLQNRLITGYHLKSFLHWVEIPFFYQGEEENHVLL